MRLYWTTFFLQWSVLGFAWPSVAPLTTTVWARSIPGIPVVHPHKQRRGRVAAFWRLRCLARLMRTFEARAAPRLDRLALAPRPSGGRSGASEKWREPSWTRPSMDARQRAAVRRAIDGAFVSHSAGHDGAAILALAAAAVGAIGPQAIDRRRADIVPTGGT